MATKNRSVLLSMFWQHLAGTFLDHASINEQTISADFSQVGTLKTKIADIRKTKDGWDLFPGQHLIFPAVDFNNRGEVLPRPFYVVEGDSIKVNLAYLKVWKSWKIREISSESFIPDDLKKLFIDPNHVLVSDIELSELENPNAFIAKQEQMFTERLAK